MPESTGDAGSKGSHSGAVGGHGWWARRVGEEQGARKVGATARIHPSSLEPKWIRTKCKFCKIGYAVVGPLPEMAQDGPKWP